MLSMKQLYNLYKYVTLYGLRLAFFYLIYPRIAGRKAILRRHYEIKRYLKRRYADILNKYRDYEEPKYIDNDHSTIWVCWLQGYDQMPNVVKKCYESVCRNAGERRVVLIEENNINDWLEIPEFIQTKVNSRTLSLTHYADYIRVALLSKYGGLWIDASIFTTSEIVPDKGYSFYSIRQNPFSIHYVSESRWIVSAIGSKRSNIITATLVELFSSYIKDNECFVDFFLLDYFMAIIYDELPKAKELIDSLPYSCASFYFLCESLNVEYSDKSWGSIKQNSQFHKLTYKKELIEKTADGKDTFWGWIVNDKLR